MVVKTVRSEEARTHLRDVLDEVTSGEAEVIIERHGKPTVAVISYREYQRILRERKKRQTKMAKGRIGLEADGDTGRLSLRPAATGPHGEYWNQFIGLFAGEEWERPPQDPVEQREEW